MANIIDLSKIDEKMDQILENQKQIKEAGVPKQETKALTESMAKPAANYKSILAKAFKDVSQSQDVSTKLLSEAIGGIDGAAACPTIWAADVMRCCPYPASAFLGAPFIKWHDDIKGKLTELLKEAMSSALYPVPP